MTLNKTLNNFHQLILDNADIIKVKPSSKIKLTLEVTNSTSSHMTKVVSVETGYGITTHELLPIKHTQLKKGIYA